MKKIYFVITNTGTIVSKIVKHFMKDEYTHISISLDRELSQMYSFGRLNPYNTFKGGFVHEYIDKGTFKRFYKTKSRICYIEVTDSQFTSLKKQIKHFKNNKKKYKFNVIGLFAIYFNIKRKKENYFYCAEFVKYVLEKSKIYLDLPELVRPQHFSELENITEIYKGVLREYPTKAVQNVENVL